MSGLRSRMRRFLQKPGSASLGGYEELLPDIAGREEALRGLSDAALTAAAAEAADDAGICALGREAARRALGERPFDVQLLGTLALLNGQVAEMATGEGKTLSGALAAAGYVRRGHRVQVMSVNDYLARRDAEWMGPVYDLLGVSVGWVTQASTPQERRQAYAADVCYGSASEIGFDVLRDRLATSVADLVTEEPDVILIDEADSVLVDEALVPLVLAGSAGAADSGREMAEIAGRLLPRLHYEVDDERRNVFLTDAGARIAEQALGGINLYAEQNLDLLTQLNVALHARALLQRDVDYIVRDDRIHLISASRGRVARRQRWPDGLHAAVEAKEGLRASETGQILDSITIQALVRRYPVACGMTGTAVAVGEQLREFYGLEIAVIPPNLPCVREDEPDRLYRTAADKEDAVVSQVADTHANGRPVLIGTLDVAESERLAERMGQAGLSCVVLNAKNDAQEAAIVAEAGALGAITVSTQMAGRGTDIRLGGTRGTPGGGTPGGGTPGGGTPGGGTPGGGTPGGGTPGGGSSDGHDRVAGLGGLLVIGMGRHASSRLDDQLRGRSGRQGDPGGSVFFVSMEDELITTCVPDAPPVPGRRARRPGHRPQGAVDGRSRPAGGRGGSPADPPGHLAVQHAAGGPAAFRAGAPRRTAANRPRAAHAGRVLPGTGRRPARVSPRGGARGGGPADQPGPAGSRLGRVPRPGGRPAGRHQPARARARPQPVRRVTEPAGGVQPRDDAAVQPVPRRRHHADRARLPDRHDHRGRGGPGRRRPGPAQRHLDLRGAGQPVRDRFRPRGEVDQPPARPALIGRHRLASTD